MNQNHCDPAELTNFGLRIKPQSRNSFAWRSPKKFLRGLWLAGFFGLLALQSVFAGENVLATNSSAAVFNVEKATHAYLDQLTPAQKARSDAYFEGGYWLQLWEYLLSAGIALLLLQARWSAKLRDLAVRWTRFKWLQTAIYALFYILLTNALTFPLTLYADFFREHQYGMANQKFGGWFGDQLIGLVVSLIFGCPLIVVLMAVVRRLKNSWHIWGAVVALAFLILSVVLGPVFIAPLFNKYTLLSDPKVLTPILRLAHANGIATDKVYVMDASRQTTKISANVSGFLGTMRITLNDNLLNGCSLPEIEAVMAHEMGHYVMNHIYKMVLFLGVVIVIGFALLRFALTRLIARAGPRWCISDIGDVAVLPLAALLLSTYFFLLTPVMNTVIRTQEMEADMFGLNAARQPDGFAQAALKLSEYRKMEPTPFEEWFFYDHPSGATRIRTAMRWKAENLGAPDAKQ
jgi:STE24 endopeptidase